MDKEIHTLNLTEDSNILNTYYNTLAQEFNQIRRAKSPSNSGAKSNAKYYKFQEKVFTYLCDIYESLSRTNISNFRTIYESSSVTYKDLVANISSNHFKNNKYVPDFIKKFIHGSQSTKDANLITYSIPSENLDNITIHIFSYDSLSENENENENVSKYDKQIIHCLAVIKLMNLLTDKQCSNKGLDITFFLTPFKKNSEKDYSKFSRLTRKNIGKNIKKNITGKTMRVLGAKNANSGFSYSCQPTGKIIIYRYEDYFKVFIHELIHNFGIDSYFFDIKQVSHPDHKQYLRAYQRFLSNFDLGKKINNSVNNGVKFDIGLQECLVEFWANFLNNVIYSFNYAYLTPQKYTDKTFVYLYTFEQNALKEIMHSCLTCAKILKKNNIEYYDILSQNKNITRNKTMNKTKNNYKETTHIFSYYILKLYLLFNYREFIETDISYKNYMITFEEQHQNVRRFFDYIISVAYNQDFIKSVKFFENILRVVKSHRVKKFAKKNKISEEIEFIITNFKMVYLEY